MRKGEKGFSLIEVLIASFIMFISLATFTMVFRSAMVSSTKAELNVSTAAYADLIVSKVASELKKHHGKASHTNAGVLIGREYFWNAEVVQHTQPPAVYVGQTLVQPEHQAKLWSIKLTIKTDNKSVNYRYQEVTW